MPGKQSAQKRQCFIGCGWTTFFLNPIHHLGDIGAANVVDWMRPQCGEHVPLESASAQLDTS
jgi:hypothetical protein